MAAVQQATTAATRLFLFCHPHNPVGRCWSRDELLALADYAERNDLVVCSDEIHCGLILDADKRHIPFASLSPAAASAASRCWRHPRPSIFPASAAPSR
jgi:cystathionine beta-lyase